MLWIARDGVVSWALFLIAAASLPVVVAQDTVKRSDIGDFPELSAQRDWPWWRGPWRNGHAANVAAPVKLDEAQNLLWKVRIPFRGHSSPTVVGNRLFLTTADERRQVQYVLGFDCATGKLLWQTETSKGGFPKKNHPKNTEATSTLACDGQRLFATFFHHESIELTALDLDGRILWQRPAGPFNPRRYEYGYAPSPLLYRQTVIVAAEYDGASFIAAFERDSGKEVWRVKRPENISFSSPVVAQVSGRYQLLISGADEVTSYDPASGKLLWSVPGTAAATCGTLVWDGNIVFASGGYPKSETVAVLADGSGKVLWRNGQKCYEQSMLAADGYLYALTDSGVVYCWRGSDGKEQWKQRLSAPVSASPVLARGNIYWANEKGLLYVFRANPAQFELVAENQVGESSFASPAICGGRVYLRVAEGEGAARQEWLYCFGN